MAHARLVFIQVIAENPDMVKSISEQSDIVHSPDFESGIGKLQKTEKSEMFGSENLKLTDFEKLAVKCIGKAIEPVDVEIEKKGASSLAERARTRIEIEVEYQVSHILPTSNMLEMAFQPIPTNHD